MMIAIVIVTIGTVAIGMGVVARIRIMIRRASGTMIVRTIATVSGRMGMMKRRRMNIGPGWIMVPTVSIKPRAVVEPWSRFRTIINLAPTHIAV
jgi:hypothetical protein